MFKQNTVWVDRPADVRARRARVIAQLKYYLGGLETDRFLGPIAKQNRGWLSAVWLLKCRKLRELGCETDDELERARNDRENRRGGFAQ